MKDYPTGKHEEELLNVPPAMVGWRVSLSCDLFPEMGDSFARIGAAGAGLTAIPWNASWDAEVQSEVEDAHLC